MIRNKTDQLSLNGTWNFKVDPQGNFAQQVLSGEPGLYWRKTDVPCDMAHACPEIEPYEGTSCFKKSFFIPKNFHGKRIVLHFEAVNYKAYVYINNNYIGCNKLGFLPFEFNITDNVFLEKENQIFVIVDGGNRDGDPQAYFLWRNSTGIIRDVSIYATPHCYIENVKIKGTAEGHTEIKVHVGGNIPKSAKIQIEILSPDGTTAAKTQTTAKQESIHTITCKNVKLWTPDTPNLYRAEISVITNEDTDHVSVKYGYREISVKDGKIILNGKPIFLRGFNRHEDNEETGGAFSAKIVDEDFARIKNSGANFLRVSYPHDSYELDKADELGLIVFDEAPVMALLQPYGVRTLAKDAQIGQHYENGLEMLRRMIDRDFNHPCVCFWSVSNEGDERQHEVVEINNALLQYAKKMDPTRLCVHVSMYYGMEEAKNFFTFDDVICINQYTSLGGRLSIPDYHISEQSASKLVATIERLKSMYPGKPVLVTEFGYMTEYPVDAVKSDEYGVECFKTEYPVMREHAAGAACWVFADHPWTYGNAMGREFSRYGVNRRDRTPKKMFFALAELMQKDKQNDEK